MCNQIGARKLYGKSRVCVKAVANMRYSARPTRNADEKKPATGAGLSPYPFEETWRRQANYMPSHVMRPISIANTRYSRGEYHGNADSGFARFPQIDHSNNTIFRRIDARRMLVEIN
jgi:hypothetical protein